MKLRSFFFGRCEAQGTSFTSFENRRAFVSNFLSLSLGLAVTGLTLQSAMATSDAWDGSTSNLWSLSDNWLTNPALVPGTLETATFNGTGNGNTIVDLGPGVAVGTILFDTATAAAYTIGSGAVGSQTLTLDNAGAVTMNATVANNQLFNSNIVLGTGITGTTTITNLTTGAGAKNITFAGTVQGGSGGTAGAKALTVSVLSGGTVTFTNAITAGGSSGVNFNTFQSSNSDVTHTGTVTFSGSVSSGFNTFRATGGSTVAINGQNVTVASSSLYGNSTTYGKFILQSGSAAFNGGLGSATSGGNPSGADGMAFIVNGGTFSASSIALGRSQNTGSTTTFFTTALNLGTSGFQVNGGTANVTGSVRIAGSNSSATGQVSGNGSLTIGGELAIGELTTRSNLFQVTGGTLTVNDTTNGGIVIGKGTAAVAAAGQLLLTGGTTTTEKISFGLNAGLAGSSGNLTLNGTSANLYVGSGGIVNNATNAYTTTINLMNGTIGAKADWSSSLNMNLAGSGVTIKAADAADVGKNITLSGVISGANGFTKTGGGTLTLTGANTYAGATTITGGTLALTGTASLASPSIIVGASTTFDVSGVTGGYTLASNQTLSGPGAVAGAMNVTGTLSPGSSPGTLNTGSEVWLNGGDYNWQMADATGVAGVGYDTISVNGSLDLSSAGLTVGGFGINLWSLASTGPDVNGNAANFNNLLPQSWTLVSTSGGITGFDESDFTINVSASNGTGGFSNALNPQGIFEIAQSGNNLLLNYTVVPEPSALLLGGLGMMALLRRRRDA